MSRLLIGFEICLHDIKATALEQARDYIESEMKKAVDRGIYQVEVDKYLEQLSCFTDLEDAAKDTDLVIEAVLEKIELKIDIFKQLDTIC